MAANARRSHLGIAGPFVAQPQGVRAPANRQVRAGIENFALRGQHQVSVETKLDAAATFDPQPVLPRLRELHDSIPDDQTFRFPEVGRRHVDRSARQAMALAVRRVDLPDEARGPANPDRKREHRERPEKACRDQPTRAWRRIPPSAERRDHRAGQEPRDERQRP
jgi:hypothetical protein